MVACPIFLGNRGKTDEKCDVGFKENFMVIIRTAELTIKLLTLR